MLTLYSKLPLPAVEALEPYARARGLSVGQFLAQLGLHYLRTAPPLETSPAPTPPPVPKKAKAPPVVIPEVEFRTLYDVGASHDELAAVYNVSTARIVRYADDLGYPTRPRGRRSRETVKRARAALSRVRRSAPSPDGGPNA